MGLAFGILTVMAGIGYILWQVHKESKGFLTCMLLMILAFCGPLLLLQVIGSVNSTAGAVCAVVYIVAVFVFFIRSIDTDPQKQQELLAESQEIWNEVCKLPLPDEDTIRAYKLANKIPLYPENVKAYNDAAIQAWRNDEYNKRFKEKHKLIFYTK